LTRQAHLLFPCTLHLDAAIIFAPDGALVVTALRNLVKGGTVVCAGIHMSEQARASVAQTLLSVLWQDAVLMLLTAIAASHERDFLSRRVSLSFSMVCASLSGDNCEHWSPSKTKRSRLW
jgi:hypothetical protein